jgi:hypothetical protein
MPESRRRKLRAKLEALLSSGVMRRLSVSWRSPVAAKVSR